MHVASRYGGRVVQLLAQEGDPIAAGQPLVELDAAELRARRAQVAALLEELERGPRPEELAAARAEWESLLAQRDLARLEEQRVRDLFEQRVASTAERDQAVARADALEKTAAAAKARYDLLLAGTRVERIAQVRAQLAEIDAQLQEMMITAPGGSGSAAVAEAATNRTERVAPFVLETLSVKVGDVVPPNREVATLLIANRLWVRVYVPARWLARIRLAQQVEVRVDGVPQPFTGVVEQINRQAEFTPRNVQTAEDRIRQVFGVKVRLPADTDVLKPGMTAEVYFP